MPNSSHNRNISIVWDFDGTLTPEDSTTEVIKLIGGNSKLFWDDVHTINGKVKKNFTQADWDRMLSSDAPTWMWSLARIARVNGIVLSKSYFDGISDQSVFALYKRADSLITDLRNLNESDAFRTAGIQVHHFIVTAGLAELVHSIVRHLKLPIENVWGCRYTGVFTSNEEKGYSVPVYCMDETMKTRAIFEIAKGVWNDPKKEVNHRVESIDLWCPFENIIYIGDGPTDIPALSVVRDRGGFGIVVYDESKEPAEVKERLHKMSVDTRCDCIVPAKFDTDGELYRAILSQCNRIKDRYSVQDFTNT